jgi:MoxR-like ATPase
MGRSEGQLTAASGAGYGPAGLADVFVGRDRERAELHAAVDAAVAARGSLLLGTGEPGMGKTRLG